MTDSLCKSKQPAYRNSYERKLRAQNPEFATKQRANSNRWRKANPARKSYYDWAYHIKQTYGLTADDYAAILKLQNGGCSLCGRKPKKNRLPIDHDHTTGRIRGILCTPCNRAIGILEPNILKVMTYLGTDDVRLKDPQEK